MTAVTKFNVNQDSAILIQTVTREYSLCEKILIEILI
jgi:hypothetical protein